MVQPKPYHHDEKRLHLGQRVKEEDQGREGGREGGRITIDDMHGRMHQHIHFVIND